MQLRKGVFASELTGVVGLVYIVCTLFVYLFPQFSSQLVGWLTHANINDRNLTFGGFIAGLVQILVYTYIGARLFAWVFNRSVRS